MNLVAEIEQRLGGRAPEPGLHPELAALVPDAETYVVVLFDGLGADQLDHPAAASLRGDLRATIDAPFPTTTTVSMSTVATGLTPVRHGLIGYQLHLPGLDVVANTIKWTTLWGEPLQVDTTAFLPAPNLWERLADAGVETVVVQPGNFAASPMTRMLYRGARFEPWHHMSEMVEVTRQMASVPDRLVFAYLPHVDYAGHVHGPGSPEHVEALTLADHLWSALAGRLPPGAAMIGTADHGMALIPHARQTRIPRAAEEGLVLYGDSRVMFVTDTHEAGRGEDLAAGIPATWVPLDAMRHWWGDAAPSPAITTRLPDGVLVADDGHVLLHRHSDDRLVGHHGGLTPIERRIPLMVAARSHPL